MKKINLEMITDALNNLEGGSSQEVFQLTSSDVRYLNAHLSNYNLQIERFGKEYIIKMSKKENKNA
jgi:hypothetical protein